MQRVLYISNIEVPYRTTFFNQLAKKCDLTVLYERKKSTNRDKKWSSSVKSEYKKEYLNGLKIKREYTFDFKILKYVFSKKYDNILIGCFNSPSQLLAIMIMRIFKKKYILNFDGEYFLEGNSIKQRLKRFIIRGADKYFVAGTETKDNLAKYIQRKKIYSYHFSSLTKKELAKNASKLNNNENNVVLVVGQFYKYKGLDIALEVAKKDSKRLYRFIGSGIRSDFLKNEIETKKIKNVEVIPFLEKKELFEQYKKCFCLLLTSRKECWGLVINEAASFGCPIISTKNSGAAIEFLSKQYNNYLVEHNDIEKYVQNINRLFSDNQIQEYRCYLLEKSKKYCIEEEVEDTLKMLKGRE